VYWSTLELEVESYPVNRVRVEIQTLSLDEEYLGV
jgi:hypothetical protein